jgi:hypothetical protein
MPKVLNVRLTEPGEERVLQATLPDEEWASIAKFLEYAKRIDATAIARDRHLIQLNMSFREGQLRTEVTLPPDEATESFLLRMRMVLLQNEPTYFYRIYNYLARRIEDEGFRRGLIAIREQFQGAGIRSILRLRARAATGEEIEVTSDETLNLWLYAEPYHGDPEKQDLLARTHKLLPMDASRALFYLMLRDKALAALNLANVVRVLNGDQESFEIRVNE